MQVQDSFDYHIEFIDFIRQFSFLYTEYQFSSSYSQEDIDKLQEKSRTEGNKLRPDKYDWIEGNETVPEVSHTNHVIRGCVFFCLCNGFSVREFLCESIK